MSGRSGRLWLGLTLRSLPSSPLLAESVVAPFAGFGSRLVKPLGYRPLLAQRAIVLEPEMTSPSSRTRTGTSLVPLSFLTSARSYRAAPGPGISR